MNNLLLVMIWVLVLFTYVDAGVIRTKVEAMEVKIQAMKEAE